jgi:hypothetical protein
MEKSHVRDVQMQLNFSKPFTATVIANEVHTSQHTKETILVIVPPVNRSLFKTN